MALQYLRKTDSPRTLWVDALCINQTDLQERSAQVQIMSHIYRGASCVFVWLGKMDAKSALAFDIVERSLKPSLEDFIDYYRGRFQRPNMTIDETRDMLKEQFTDLTHCSYLFQLVSSMGCEVYDLDEKIHEVEEAINHTFTAEGIYQWWKRLWVIQEVLYARNVRLVCGTRSIAIDDVSHIYDGLAYCRANARTRVSLTKLSWLLSLEQLRIDNALFDLKKPKGALDRNLINFQMRDSSDPRDRIYSLLNLSCFKLVQMLPDYSKQVNAVFSEAARVIIGESGSLNMIICLKCNQRSPLVECRVKGLPSWVPDFSTWPDPNIQCFQLSGFGLARVTNYLFMAEAHQNPYCAAGHSRTSSEVTKFKDVFNLQVKGILIDTVDSITKLITPCTQLKDLSRALAMWESPSLDRPYVAGGSALEAHWRSLVKDTYLKFTRLGNGLSANSERHNYREWKQRAKADPKGRKMDDTEEHFLNNCIVSGIRESQFLTTRKGYVGLTEGSVGTQDKVFVVLGCTVPLILLPLKNHGETDSRNSSRYTMIGRAYVHGIMDGEILDNDAGLWMREGGYETIELV